MTREGGCHIGSLTTQPHHLRPGAGSPSTLAPVSSMDIPGALCRPQKTWHQCARAQGHAVLSLAQSLGCSPSGPVPGHPCHVLVFHCVTSILSLAASRGLSTGPLGTQATCPPRRALCPYICVFLVVIFTSYSRHIQRVWRLPTLEPSCIWSRCSAQERCVFKWKLLYRGGTYCGDPAQETVLYPPGQEAPTPLLLPVWLCGSREIWNSAHRNVNPAGQVGRASGESYGEVPPRVSISVSGFVSTATLMVPAASIR